MAVLILPQKLAEIANRAAELPHGGKSAYLKEQAALLGISVQTLHRRLKADTVRTPRKRRSDAGKIALSLEDAKMIAAALMVTPRNNGKQLMTVEAAVDMLIANNEIDPVRVDKETGEVVRLSASTICRALKHYRLHPKQLNQPDPVNALQSLYPNHCWQIDASLCVLFYLPSKEKPGRSELNFMDAAEFYKNKPRNLERIALDRVWRYVVYDHCSGCIFVWYVFGGENSENLCETFIQAMQPKADRGRFPFCGRPTVVMLDPGAANTGYGFNNLCSQFEVKVQINKPGNARAKGGVENGNNLVETQFEGKLKFQRIDSIEQLQEQANQWMMFFNGVKKHSRTNISRFAAWQKIRPEQLILPPPADYCRELVLSRPEARKVKPDLTVSVGSKLYDVREVPFVMVGESLIVAKNPWRKGAVRVQRFDENGQEYWLEVPEVAINEWGFRADAAVIGEEYKAHADTPAQTNKKELEKLVYGAATQEEVAAKRKAKALPFDGRINPFAHQEQALAADNRMYLQKQGTQMDYNRMEVREQVLSKVELAKLLKPRIEAAGGNWGEAVKTLQRLYPDGVAASQIEEVFGRLKTAGSLRIVKGA